MSDSDFAAEFRAAVLVASAGLCLREEATGWALLEYVVDGDVWMICSRGMKFADALAMYLEEVTDRALKMSGPPAREVRHVH